MKKVSGTGIAGALLLIGFVLVFQLGRSAGFKSGSEWALVQADILAREAGLSMPVYLDGNNFRVVIKQQRGLYKRAWELADKYDQKKSLLKAAKMQDLDPKRTADTPNGL